MKRVITAVVFALGLALPSVASADVRGFATTFNPNDPTPSFNAGPAYPLIPFSVSYDSGAGVLTFSEGGGSALYTGGWYPVRLKISGPTNLGDAQWDYATRQPGGLSVSGVQGTLQPVITKTGDTLTATYSSPLLVGLDYDYVRIEGASGASVSCDYSPCDAHIADYFPGYTPTISLPSPGAQSSTVGSPVTAVELGAPSVVGQAYFDSFIPATPDESVTGLPPGLEDDDGYVSGTPTTPGVYTVTLTATAQVNDGIATISNGETISNSVSFPWTIAGPPSYPAPKPQPRPTRQPVKVPTGYTGPQVKPYTLTFTGDGSSFLGGPTGHRTFGGNGKRITMKDFGRLRWTQYTATDGKASGVVWSKFGPGPLAADGFKNYGRISLHVYRPRNGVFTRMTMQYGRHSATTFTAVNSDGYWYWSSV
jgi:hypothetical protein